MLCEAMEEIKQCSLKQIKDTTDLNLNEIEMKPLCSFAQEEQLQVFIDKLNNMFNSNKVIYKFQIILIVTFTFNNVFFFR